MVKKVSCKFYILLLSVVIGIFLGTLFYKYENEKNVVYESKEIEVANPVFDGKPIEYSIYKEDILNGADPEVYKKFNSRLL